MTIKTIYPGNWINPLASWSEEAAIAVPGAQFYSVTGYAPIPVGDANKATTIDIIVPSPDVTQEYGKDKPQLIIPGSAAIPSLLYRIGMRAPIFFNGTATDIIKIATVITDTAVPSITAQAADAAAGYPEPGYRPAENTTFSFPGAGTPTSLTSDTTYKLFCADNTGIAAGTGIYAATPARENIVIVDLCYYRWNNVPTVDDIVLPNLVEDYTATT